MSVPGSAPPSWVPTSTNLLDLQNGPLAKAGAALYTAYFNYQVFLSKGGTSNFATDSANSLSKLVEFQGNSVGVDVSVYTDANSSLTDAIGALKGLGMQVTATDSKTGIVEGLMPISQIPTAVGLRTVAGQPLVVGMSAIIIPKVGTGAAEAQSDPALFANVARQQYGVDGTGVNVGVLSDSVGRVGGGLADSQRTNDLPPNVQVVQENPTPGGTDEGRAMLEIVHDIAPGSNLAFASAFGGEANFAQNIINLATQAKDQIIADDVYYADEPFFQDGMVAQAVTTVSQSGTTYFSLSHNFQDVNNDEGFQSPFRGLNTTVNGVGAGRFMNFDPNGQNALLPVTVNAANAQGDILDFQFDQPFFQSNGVTSNVNMYLLSSTGAVISPANGDANQNNVAMQQPIQLFYKVPASGNYFLAIQVVSGPDPSYIRVQDFGEGGVYQFSKQYGNAGGISYPTAYGHEAAAAAIGVGAVPWYGTQPYYNPPGGVISEPFSGTGPSIITLAPDGTRLSSPVVIQHPDISGVDGVSTTFFGSPHIDTSNAPFPPSTPTDLNASNTFPNFFGTSAATPGIAAVGALMKQLNPGATTSQIRAAMIDSAMPINGNSPGNWEPKGGYGLVNAIKALNNINLLNVQQTAPATGVTLTTSTPSSLTVTFSKPVAFSQINSGDLQFTSAPPGVFVSVGTPILINATTVQFPLTLNTVDPTASANGQYKYTLGPAGAFTSTDGKPLVPYSGNFTLKVTTSPTITNVLVGGRIIVVNFSEAMRPATLSQASGGVELIRTNNPLGLFDNPSNINILNNPNAILFYDAANNRLIIDLSQVSQADLPSDRYALVVNGTVRDAVGNQLDGHFNGTFPTGDGMPGSTFVYDLGRLQVAPPSVTDLELAPSSDTGIKNDGNTRDYQPTFIGSISNTFPGTLRGVTIEAEFGGLHGGSINLTTGAQNRGFNGTVDVTTTTDANGNFSFRSPGGLPDGFQQVRIVAVGAADSPPLPGLSAQFQTSFRVATFSPFVISTSILNNQKLSSLTSLTIGVADPVAPTDPASPFAVPKNLLFPALDPNTANNVNNYQLINLGASGVFGAADNIDESAFITSATFTSTTPNPRNNSFDWYTGQVVLTFAPGLPTGRYAFIIKTPTSTTSGLTDAAGNPFIGNPPDPTPHPYVLNFNFQPEPAYITSYQAVSYNPDGSTAVEGPRSYYEVPLPGNTPRAAAPPTQWNIDFSNPMNPKTITNNSVWIVGSSNTYGGTPDGNFGDLGMAGGNTTGFSKVPGVTVTVTSSVPGAIFGQPGYMNRLVVRLPANQTLPADYYRFYIPNQVVGGQDLRMYDQFGNQVDGEFLGVPTSTGYQDLQPNGQIRPGLSGDGIAGGAFTTAFVVAPNGNVIFARADYVEDPFQPGTYSDGSPQKPYAVLAPEGDPAISANLNDPRNFTQFNQSYNRSGSGHFDLSAFYAAQVLSANGPVVIVAEPSARIVDPFSGSLTEKPFVFQAPSGPNPVLNDGSGSVPYGTTLVFQGGSIVKLLNASLFAQNQGSAIQVDGTGPLPQNQVIFTSYLDNSAGGNSDPSNNGVLPHGGDWGGIVFRNFTQQGRTDAFPVDGTLKGPGGAAAISGADEGMSIINYALVRYAGGAVPATNGFRYDAISNFNSRPVIADTTVADTGQSAGAQGAISGNLDSFREDDLARGLLVRFDQFLRNSINGIYVRAELNGLIEATNSVAYPNNPGTAGGVQNYTFDSPYPYVLTAGMFVGQTLQVDSGGRQGFVNNRVNILPGMLFKFQRGASITVDSNGSISLGTESYIKQFDANPNFGPSTPGFVAPGTTDAPVLFTSLFDLTASTAYTDPLTGFKTTIVAPLDSANQGPNSSLEPTPTSVNPLARWGAIIVNSGGLASINEAIFQYGGGSVNVPNGTRTQVDVLDFEGEFATAGTRAYVTNNTFQYNSDTPIGIDPNGLLAADPSRPLLSGHPFFRGNILQGNDINGLGVRAPNLYLGGAPDGANATVSELWDATDITYVLRGTIVMYGAGTGTAPSVPDLANFGLQQKPSQVITLQSALPNTLLANDQSIGQPGESLIVKLLGDTPPGDAINGSSDNLFGGAGFIVGVDNGVDNGQSLIDAGVNSQLRIEGISGNQTTGQARVPVVITSLHDDSVGTTVRGVKMYQATAAAAAPKPGDGGLIYIGGLSLASYNPLDPREGSRIDNADIRYLTRIEVQGGGFQDVVNQDNQTGFAIADNPIAQHWGTAAPLQHNMSMTFEITNSNLAHFSQVGVLAHPGFNEIIRDVLPSEALIPRIQRSGFSGEPVDLLLINDTISDMGLPAVGTTPATGAGVRVVAETVSDTQGPEPFETVLLNDTFFNDNIGVDIIAPQPTNQNFQDHVNLLAMDNIFSNNGFAGVQLVGRTQNIGGQTGQGQYNLFWQNGKPVSPASDVIATNSQGWANNQAVFGDPMFMNAAGGDFSLQPNSAAIDAARSELSATYGSDLFTPIAAQTLTSAGGTRLATARMNDFNPLQTTEVLTLPGYALRNYIDNWAPAIPNSPGSYPGTGTISGSYWYTPITGERDLLGNLRVDDPNKPNVGFGSRPFFDIGAYEYIQQFPAHIVDNPASGGGVAAVVTNPNAPNGVTDVNIYKVGGTGGVNQAPQALQIKFDQALDPTSINAQDVLLEASGQDGVFGNNNNPNDRFINLSGKLSFNSTTDVLTINLAAAGLVLNEDQYRLFILGTGPSVVRNLQGLPIDGSNLDANGVQLALPSGSVPSIYPAGIPGSTFQMTFSVITQPPTIISGSLQLAPSSDTNVVGDRITKINTPTFIGKVTDPFPAIDPLGGMTVQLDFSSKGNGVFDLLNYASGTTDVNGNFSITLTKPLPDSPYQVGTDGFLGDPGSSGFTLVRAVATDVAGNQSDPNNFNATNNLVVDTKNPVVTGSFPQPNTQAQVSNGAITVSFTTNENIYIPSLNANDVVITRSGGDGIFGNANDVTVPFDPTTLVVTPLHTQQGAERISFQIKTGLVNDVYRLQFTNGVIDIAGNSLIDSQTLQSFSLQFVVFNPALSTTIFVGQNVQTIPGAPAGSRENPYKTIAAGLNVALIGDTVAVLPGVYNEAVTLKPLIKLASASTSSTDALFIPGDPRLTVIRPPAASTGRTIAVSASNLLSLPVFNTEITGFAIATPLIGDPATGTIDPDSIGLYLDNANVLVDRNFFIDSGAGILMLTARNNNPNPTFVNDLIAGNIVGLLVNDAANPSSTRQLTIFDNNTVAFNTYGIEIVSNPKAPVSLDVANSIFWQNNDRLNDNIGQAIVATNPNPALIQNDLFYLNQPGSSPTNPIHNFETYNLTNFDPNSLTTTPAATGNFYANPAFSQPIDPRPNFDGPAKFFLDSNYDLTYPSAAIDAANQNLPNITVPTTDILYRGRVTVSGKGYPGLGLGPADIGAYEYGGTAPGNGSGGTPPGYTPRFAAAASSSNGTPASQVAVQSLAVAVPPADVARTSQTAAVVASSLTSTQIVSPTTASASVPSTASVTPPATVQIQTVAPAQAITVFQPAPNPAPDAPTATVVVLPQTTIETPAMPEHVARKLAVLHRGIVPHHHRDHAPAVDHGVVHHESAPRIEAASHASNARERRSLLAFFRRGRRG